MIEDCERIIKTTSPQELFGTNEKRSKIVYRRLARAVHPDLYPDSEKKIASQAFVKLTEYWELYQNGAKTSTDHGKKAPKAGVMATGKHEYTLGDMFSDEGIYARYRASYDAGHQPVELFVTKDPTDNDLTGQYAEFLKLISSEVPEKYHAFYPGFVEKFRYRGSDNRDHTVLAQTIPSGFSPMTKILEVYPQGINGRDVAWMFKRMLTALGNAHDIGLVHGAATLNSFLIHPELHGLILSEWQYAVREGEVLTAIQAENQNDYPQSVFDKEPATVHLDIAMAAKAARKLLHKDAPRQLHIFFQACMTTKKFKAAELLREFDILLERLYGPPRFHEFTLNP